MAGLCAYCRAEGIGAIIDATHPFAAQMSNHAVAAAAALGLPLAALERPPWQPVAGDRWIGVASMAEAAQHLVGRRVFLGIGRNELAAFGGGTAHRPAAVRARAAFSCGWSIRRKAPFGQCRLGGGARPLHARGRSRAFACP
ncbi:precorrin-6A/cobalt-precorrin-6A reductase [Paracoccus cavernae]|uniref:Precorrin-6A/cobalt-precorrin-6A reductase n=1 Tax=Paracoccus cavernae TaxID=1571207 RepID=A0ABT8D5H9_9RHOB|nr:precorrin-6A/cobalt-precorrin-6A reductase [Paracoccus cavernae]